MLEIYLIYRFLDIFADGFIKAPMVAIGLSLIGPWYFYENCLKQRK
jgi:hypothetical protein